MTSAPGGPSSIPVAIVRDRRGRWDRVWMLTGLALALSMVAIVLVGNSRTRTEIVITFADGHGLKPGDALRHRGIDVGRVTHVELDGPLSKVRVTCELFPSAESLARVGTQFWIVRPTISLSGIKGLETLLGGRYVAVVPAPASSDTTTEFEGLSDPPSHAAMWQGGLEIMIEAPQRLGLDRGTPILFRGMHVGEILTVGLATDGLTVQARGVIAAEYRSLVRDNSVFWNDRGVNVHMGLSGFDLDVGTLESFAVGGIAFATPSAAGQVVHTGHRFVVRASAPKDWPDWRPNLVVGNSALPDGLSTPTLLRAEVIRTRHFLGIRRESRASGWVLPLDDGRILGPPELLLLPSESDDPPPRLAVSGQEWVLAKQNGSAYGELTILELDQPGLQPETGWPRTRLRHAEEVEDCLIFADIGVPPIALSRHRLNVDGPLWRIDPAVTLSPDLLGGAVVSRKDGAMVGLIGFHNDRPVVLTVPQGESP